MKNIMVALFVVLAITSAYALEWSKACAYVARTDPNAKWLLQNDGQGVYIKSWVSSVAKPTKAELEAVEADAIAWYDDKDKTDKASYTEWTDKEKAMLKFLVKQINALRTNAGLDPLTVAQVKAGIKAEL